MVAVEHDPGTSRPSSKHPGDYRQRLRTWLHRNAKQQQVPVHAKTDKIPYLPHWEGHKWILIHACWPMLLHQFYAWCTNKNLSPLAAFLFYNFAFVFNTIREVIMLRNLGYQYGYLDGDQHRRDEISDHRPRPLWRTLGVAISRPLMSVMLAYRRSQTPITMSWWLPVEIGLYCIVLDFWFYWYHRCMHDVDFLWKYHRTHHLTKHPSPLLAGHADVEQEIFDAVIIPVLTYGTMKMLAFPMGFYEWWICHMYVVFTELWGHSGLRLYVTPATTATPLLNLLNAELTTEDHDLHHRKGWKSSHNYGKQTLLWDRLFGTCHERYETIAENIDWSSPARLPLF